MVATNKQQFCPVGAVAFIFLSIFFLNKKRVDINEVELIGVDDNFENIEKKIKCVKCLMKRKCCCYSASMNFELKKLKGFFKN